MNQNVIAAADQAVEMLEPALVTLMDIFGDSQQQGPVRVAAARAALDFGLKLADKVDPEQGTLEKLDAILQELRGSVGADGEPEGWD